MTLPETDQARLAQIRMRHAIASAQMNTEHWESTFFLRIINELLKEIKCEK